MVLSNVPVVIFAGGKGERLQPQSSFLPKPLLLHQGVPMLDKVINNFSSMGFCRFFLVLHHDANLIMSYLSCENRSEEIHFIIEEKPLGTAGGLAYLKPLISETFIVCNCDNLGAFDFSSALSDHIKKKRDITVFVKRQRYTIPFGIINTDNDATVYSIDEKPEIEFFASTGIHIMDPSVLQSLDMSVLQMPDFINSIAKNHLVGYFDVGDALWVDMSV